MPCPCPVLLPVALLIEMGCTSFLDSSGHSLGCAGNPSQRGLGGSSCSGPLPCLDSALGAPGNQRAWFLGGRRGLWQGSGLMGCLLPVPESNRRAAVPSRGPPGQQGELGEGRLSLHPQQVLRQGCLLSVFPVPAHVLLQLLEEACEGQDGGWWIEPGPDGGAPGLRERSLANLSKWPSLRGRSPRRGWGGRHLHAQPDTWPWLHCPPPAQMPIWAWGHFPRHHCHLSFIPRGRGELLGGCKPWKVESPRSEQNGPLSSGNSSSEAVSSSSEVQRSNTGCPSRSRSSGRAPVISSLQGRKQRLHWWAPLGVELGRMHRHSQQHPY